MTETEVVAVAMRARSAARQAQAPHLARLGRACAHLHTLGWTWEKIGKAMGVNLTTAYRWARPYLPPGEE